jgi:hypothetical protein
MATVPRGRRSRAAAARSFRHVCQRTVIYRQSSGRPHLAGLRSALFSTLQAPTEQILVL